MVSQVSQPVPPIIIGRDSELDRFWRALYEAQQGHGRSILLGGEAGVGKTRLVAEVQDRAVNEGFAVLEGQSFEQDLSFPYSLWINALREFFAWRDAAEIKRLVGPLASEFAKLLPELALILPDLQPTLPLDPESEKRRLFEAIARFVSQLATNSPLLVIFEDLHWSDQASLEFLRAFARRVADHRILLILTYRNDAQPPHVAHFLSQVQRERTLDVLVLTPLNRQQTADLTRNVLQLDRSPSDEFLNLVMRLTEGNPYFIEEILKTLNESGKASAFASTWKHDSANELRVPPRIYDLVQQRMEKLSAESRRILVLAATIGQRFSFELLRQVSLRHEHEVLLAIRELLTGQLLVEESAEQFAFRHALTREAVYASILLRERQALHRVIGEKMELHSGAPGRWNAGELAYHFYQAAVWDKAFAYSQSAGEQAQRLFAPREALTHFSRALEAAAQLNRVSAFPILTGRAHALESLGEFERARVDYEMALESARREVDHQGEWATLIDLGFLWQSRDWVRAGNYFELAFRLAQSLEELALIAQSQKRIGNWHLNRGQPREALSYHQQALQLFQKLNDQRGAAQTLELMAFDQVILGDAIKGAFYYEQAVSKLRELDDRPGLVNALTNLALRARFDTEVLGDIDLYELANLCETALEIARSCGYRKGEADALGKGALCLCRAGDYGRGLEYLRQATRIAEEIEHKELLTTLHLVWGIELYSELLAWPEARKQLEEALAAAQEAGHIALTLISTARLASVYILENDFARAQELLNGLLHTDLPDATGMTFLLRGAWTARAELELALGNYDYALAIVELLLGSTANLAKYGSYAVPRLSQLHGRALSGLGRAAEAAAEFQGAQAVAQRQGRRPLLWRLHADLGKVYRAMRRRAEAEQEFSSARAIIQQLADTLPDSALRKNFLKQSLATFPSAGAHSPRQIAMKEFGGLTERERQVAVLIAQGKSNREIATALVLTVRTVEAHVTRILDKLGLKSRVEIAAWTVAKGLTQPPY